jgi:hypothetical protein
MSPDESGGPAARPAATRPHHKKQVTTDRSRSARRLHVSPATAWRDGWRYGFIDACRLAARNTDDPQVWAVLSRLAVRYGPDEFGRANPEDYTLAGGDD